MKTLSLLLLMGVSIAWTQSAETGDTVIATFDDGVKITLDEFQTLLRVNPDWQRQDREQVLSHYATLRKAAAMVKSQKLDQKSPYKESLEFSLILSLADIEVREVTNSVVLDAAEVEKFYQEHKEPFKVVQVSGIKVAYDDHRTREEAKTKAEKLAARIRSGADFAQLVEQESDDTASKAKGGYIATWRVSDNVPAELRSAVFSLKQGEVSDPLLQPDGYYIIHADSVSYPPLTEVRETIETQLKKEHVQQWIRDLERNTKVTFPGKQELPPSSR
jgi:peptidyl-prolyl cis-trans isomerase C